MLNIKIIAVSVISYLLMSHPSTAIELDRIALLSIDGKMGCLMKHTGKRVGWLREQVCEYRRSLSVLSLTAKFIDVREVSTSFSPDIGTLAGASQYLVFDNCSDEPETRTYKLTVTHQVVHELENSTTLGFSSSFKGSWALDLGEFGKLGLEQTSGTNSTNFEKKRSVNTQTQNIEESYTLTAPANTRKLYGVEISGGRRETRFVGTLVFDGVIYTAVQGPRDWEDYEERRISDVIPVSHRTLDFDGTLVETRYENTHLSKFSIPLTAAHCEALLEGASVPVNPRPIKRSDVNAMLKEASQ